MNGRFLIDIRFFRSGRFFRTERWKWKTKTKNIVWLSQFYAFFLIHEMKITCQFGLVLQSFNVENFNLTRKILMRKIARISRARVRLTPDRLAPSALQAEKCADAARQLGAANSTNQNCWLVRQGIFDWFLDVLLLSFFPFPVPLQKYIQLLIKNASPYKPTSFGGHS